MPLKSRFPLLQFQKALTLTSLILVGFSVEICAQQSQVKIAVSTGKSLEIQIKQGDLTDSWSFLNAIGGTLGLGERISNFKASNRGENVSVKRVATGEYRGERPALECSYSVDLSKPEPGNMAHASWLSSNVGLLMMADLLPRNLMTSHISLEFVVPTGWNIHSMDVVDAGRFVVSSPEKAVFLIGTTTRKHARKIDNLELTLVVSGTWPFSNSKVLEMAAKVIKKYENLTQYPLRNSAVIYVAPMPVPSAVSKWKAETRGSATVLLIDPTARFATWNGQFGVIFTHELFHLWVPNSLQLQGDYDWFFEGFSLYQGLLTARDLKLISSEEFLNTLARVLDSYLSYSQNVSLIDASERRWANPGSYVYDKGMLVAFMYDLITRTQNGTRSLPDVYRELFAAFAGKPGDANEVIIRLLGSSKETRELCDRYIRGQSQLEFEGFLSQFGFRLNTNGNRSIISVAENLTSEQRGLIRSLGLKV